MIFFYENVIVFFYINLLSLIFSMHSILLLFLVTIKELVRFCSHQIEPLLI
jgi:hypothetical protein